MAFHISRSSVSLVNNRSGLLYCATTRDLLSISLNYCNGSRVIFSNIIFSFMNCIYYLDNRFNSYSNCSIFSKDCVELSIMWKGFVPNDFGMRMSLQISTVKVPPKARTNVDHIWNNIVLYLHRLHPWLNVKVRFQLQLRQLLFQTFPNVQGTLFRRYHCLLSILD